MSISNYCFLKECVKVNQGNVAFADMWGKGRSARAFLYYAFAQFRQKHTFYTGQNEEPTHR